LLAKILIHPRQPDRPQQPEKDGGRPISIISFRPKPGLVKIEQRHAARFGNGSAYVLLCSDCRRFGLSDFHSEDINMSLETILIVVVIVFLLGGGGWYWQRGRG
jgi:hypothetical protein